MFYFEGLLLSVSLTNIQLSKWVVTSSDTGSKLSIYRTNNKNICNQYLFNVSS